MTINIVDVIAVLVVVVAIVFGWRSGFAVQSLALAGFLAGIAIIVLLAPTVAELLAETDPMLRSVMIVVGMASIVLVAQGLGSGLGVAVRRRLGSGVLSGVDQGAGAMFGIVRGIFMVWLLGGLAGVLPLPVLAAEARQSTILRTLDTRLPSPVVLAAELGRVMQAYGLPDVFVGAPPPPAPPLDGPATQEAERIAAAARASTLRVEATACGHFLTGTGFAITTEHVVTNAHVVAGSDRVWASFDGSLDRFRATVVHYDPELDAALLHVDGLGADALALAAAPPERGDVAAALGFTGGGRQRLIPAVVSRNLGALGRDIYGTTTVQRNVVEMRADVAPGDSGGPVLLPDGSVGGITFSESHSDPSIGYALSPVAVASSIAPALNSEAAASTGRCLR